MRNQFYTFKPKKESEEGFCCKLCGELYTDPKAHFCEKCGIEFKERDLIIKNKNSSPENTKQQFRDKIAEFKSTTN